MNKKITYTEHQNYNLKVQPQSIQCTEQVREKCKGEGGFFFFWMDMP